MAREPDIMSLQDLEKKLLMQTQNRPIASPTTASATTSAKEEPFPIAGLNARNAPTNTWKQTYADIIDRLWELEVASLDPMLRHPGAKQQFVNNLVWRSVFYYLHGIQKGRREASLMDTGLLMPIKK